MSSQDVQEDRFDVLAGGVPVEDREERLEAGGTELAKQSRKGLLANRNALLIISSVLMTLGLSAILLGWIGAARSTHIEEQLPYLISGGLLGLALSIIGAVTLFAQWLTVLIKEERTREVARRRDHLELMAALRASNRNGTTSTRRR